jgi:phytoene synthase
MTADLDPDRRLVLAYAPAKARPALEALWRLDVTLGAVVAGAREKMVARIRLAWWREALERLDAAPPPAEPLLEALAAVVLSSGVAGRELAAMEEGWSVLLDDSPLDAAALRTYAAQRGGLLFRHGAQLLGAAGEVEPAGARWALVDLARHSSRPDEAAAAMRMAAEIAAPPAWPKALRPLAMLSLLARRDLARGGPPFERQGSPGRMARLLACRLTGR